MDSIMLFSTKETKDYISLSFITNNKFIFNFSPPRQKTKEQIFLSEINIYVYKTYKMFYKIER